MSWQPYSEPVGRSMIQRRRKARSSNIVESGGGTVICSSGTHRGKYPNLNLVATLELIILLNWSELCSLLTNCTMLICACTWHVWQGCLSYLSVWVQSMSGRRLRMGDI